MVLWQRWATCRRGQRPSISNRVPRDLAILLDLQKHCGSLKPRQFWQKRSLQQSHFRGRKQISFLDSQRGAPSVSRTVVVNSFFIVHVFSAVTVAKAAVWKGITCGCFCLGPAPFSCWFVFLAAKRKSGWRICGSLICDFVLFGCDLICLCFGAGQLCYVPPFSPLMYLLGPCHRAVTAKLEEKKKI